MNARGCYKLAHSGETGNWFRAVNLKYWEPTSPLSTAHTKPSRTRFSPGDTLPATRQFEILYLAENHNIALLEVGALVSTPTGFLASPATSWATITITLNLQFVVDLSLVKEQKKLRTNAQELTGDWVGYATRSATTSVKEPTGIAPTQELGSALFHAPEVEAFRTLSAKVPDCKALIVFPDKMKAGSWLRFVDPRSGRVHQVDGVL